MQTTGTTGETAWHGVDGTGQPGRAAEGGKQPPTLTAEEPVTVRELLDRLISHARVHRGHEGVSINLRLEPAHLGRVEVHLSWQGHALTAQFLVDRPEARQALEANLAQLQQMLRQDGLEVAGLEVALGQRSDAFTERRGDGWRERAGHDAGPRRVSGVAPAPAAAVGAGYARWLNDGTVALDYRA